MGLSKVVRKRLVRILVMVFCGAVFSWLFMGHKAASITIGVAIWVSLYLVNVGIVDLIDRRFSWLHQPILRMSIGVIAMVTATILDMLLVVILGYYFFYRISPGEMLARIGGEDYMLTIFITLSISMFLQGRGFYISWKDALVREERLKNESLKSQYESLKNQVNPHFLFNSLNVLSGLVYEDQKKAVEFIQKMSNVYRYVLDKKDQELVPLQEELAFLTSYVFLQQIRFGESFQLVLEQEGDGYVPPLALQLLVENAIKHNVVSEAHPLQVEVHIGASEIRIKNTIREKLSKDSTGIGLSNLKARYQYLSDRPMVIYNDGHTFEVILPLLQINK